jgi:3,4-dihydroxyphenylacetate 2,3-dioxygenase
MGRIAAAALVSHSPAVMLSKSDRMLMGGGVDTDLIAGYGRLRQRFDRAGVDTFVIFDTHWFTTSQLVVAGREHFRGIYTSDELPGAIDNLEYNYPGAPALASQIEKEAEARGIRFMNTVSPHITPHFSTLNILHHLHRGEDILSVGVCMMAEIQNFLEFGELIARGIMKSDAQVALIASGGMSHNFWPFDEVEDHMGFSADHVRSQEARSFDERIIRLWAHGDHAAVIDMYPDYRALSPDALFGHYLMMVGAIGGRSCRAQGSALSAYENAIGTGQIHVWFDLDETA